MSVKKKEQLGMNPSTASARLVKDTLWRLVVMTSNNFCYRCGKEMTREDFSIEHKIAWLDSENPVELYFDQNNISFSHLTCNVKDARSGRKVENLCGTHQAYDRGCRCSACISAKKVYRKVNYCPEARHHRYKSTGH